WTWSRVPTSRRGKLSAIHGAWRNRHDYTLHFDVFRNCSALGPSIWFLKGDAGRTRTTGFDNAGPNNRWRNRLNYSRLINIHSLSYCRLSSEQCCERSAGPAVYGDDSDCFRSPWYSNWI